MPTDTPKPRAAPPAPEALKSPPADVVLVCANCGHSVAYAPNLPGCPRCQSEWLEARYDYAALGRSLPAQLARRPKDLWRYRGLLPNCPNLYIKDERQMPTGSFKDRQATVAVSALREAGLTEVVIASTGNVAISYAAYCARAGIKLYAFLTSMCPAEKMREVALHGAQVIKEIGRASCRER